MSEQIERERSSEEEDTLARSTKKYKDHHPSPSCGAHSKGETFGSGFSSYRDRLVGAIPGAYEQAFGFASSVHGDGEMDEDAADLREGCVAIGLSREEKQRIRAPWALSIIVKTFGRKVGFMFLSSKVRALWNPLGRMDCIDIGHDYFLLKFELQSDLDNVLKGGPWFVGQHFLAIRQWEPDFRPSLATFSSVAVWVRFPELPLEFYEPSFFKKMGTAIGPVLRIDAHTVHGARGRYARLCIQVNLEEPLPNTVLIGQGRVQAVQYEGINQLCFSCGRVGHRKEVCPYVARAPTPIIPSDKANTSAVPEKMSTTGEGVFGEWMMVTKRKNFISNKKGGAMDKYLGKDPMTNVMSHTQEHVGQRDGKRKAQIPTAKVVPHTALTTSGTRNKGKGNLVSSKAKVSTKLSATNLIVTDPLVFTAKSTSNFIEPNFSFGNVLDRGLLGNFPPTQGNSNRQRDHKRDSGRSNLHLGLVRSRDDGSLAEPFSTHGDKLEDGVSRSIRSGVAPHPESVVVLPHGPPSASSSRSNDISLVCTAIPNAPIGKLSHRTRSGASLHGDCSKTDSPGDTDRMCCDGQPLSSEVAPILYASDRMHSGSQEYAGLKGDSQARCDSASKPSADEGSFETSMDVEGDRV